MSQIATKERMSRLLYTRKLGCDSSGLFADPATTFHVQRSCALGKIKLYRRTHLKKKAIHSGRFDRLIKIVNEVVADNQLNNSILRGLEKFGIEQEFEMLADEWERETRNISPPRRIAEHPIVQKIIAMGDVAIPLILKRMTHRPWFWFHALRQLTPPKSNPVAPEMRGNMQMMTEAWIKWGEDRGYI